MNKKTTAKKKSAAASPTARVSVHAYPTLAEFYQPDAIEPYSTLGNGPAGSEAADALAARIERLRRDGVTVSVHTHVSPK